MMDSISETIILVKARFLAEIHMGDNDELGVLARALMQIIDAVRPDIIGKMEYPEQDGAA